MCPSAHSIYSDIEEMILLGQHFRTPLGKKLGVTKFNAYNNSQIHRLKVKKIAKKKKRKLPWKQETSQCLLSLHPKSKL